MKPLAERLRSVLMSKIEFAQQAPLGAAARNEAGLNFLV